MSTYSVRRKKRSQNLILEALFDCEKSFGDLLALTDLSHPTLTSNLEEMRHDGLLKKRIGAEDKRARLYSLDNKGRNRLEKQRDIEFLESSELDAGLGDVLLGDNVQPSPEKGSNLEAITSALKPAIEGEVKICTWTPSATIPNDSITYNVYPRGRKTEDAAKCIKRLAKTAKTAMLDKIGDLTERELEQIPSFTVLLRFRSDKITDKADTNSKDFIAKKSYVQ